MQKLSVLLIEDNPDFAAIVGSWLSRPDEDVEYELNWTDSLAAGMHRLHRGEVSVVLLDLNLPDSQGAATLAAIRAESLDVPVIVLSAEEEVSLALRLIQQGADDYLVKSTCNADVLARSVRYALVKYESSRRRREADTPREAKIVTVVGGKGGVGATTVACTLASELRRTSGAPVLLADLDWHGGLVAFLMGVTCEYSILYAVSNAGRLDRRMWERIVVPSKEGVDVVCSPAVAGPIAEIDGDFPDRLRSVISSVGPFYRWIVLDGGRLVTCPPAILQASDKLIVITTSGIPALYETKRAVETLRAAKLEDRIRLAVNRTNAAEVCPEAELHGIFGLPVAAVLPASGKELQDAYLQKRLPARNCGFTRELAKLAEAVGVPREAETKRPLLSLAKQLLGKGRLEA